MGCAGTHSKCETQVDAERLVHELAEALQSRDPLERETVLERYLRWC